MPDLVIPGVSGNADIQKLIEELMKVERIPRDRAAARLKELESIRKAWVDMNARLVKLRESARNLFSYKNPFSERIARSSDENALTATATREALEGVTGILVKQVATADRFISKTLAKDYRVDAGTYAFKVGDKSVEVQFAGGSLKEFADAVNSKAKDLVRVQVVPVTSTESALVIEAAKTGSANRLVFEKSSVDLALGTGMMVRSSGSERLFAPSASTVSGMTGPLDASRVRLSDGTIVLSPGGEAKLGIQPPASGKNLWLEYQIRVTDLPPGAVPTAPTGPSIPSAGSLTYEGITVDSDPFAVDLPPLQAPPPPKVVEDSRVAFLGTSSGEKALPAAPAASDGWVTVRVPLADYGDASSIAFRNANTGKSVEVRGIRVYDPDDLGGLAPANPVSTARDAIIEMDGIEIRRDSNVISDLIPGVTLTVKEATSKPIRLSVEPDRKAVKDAIIEFVGLYNRVVADINVLTRNEQAIVEELDYLGESEKKTAYERLGMLQGDITLSQIKAFMQRLMMDPSRSPLGEKDLVLLAQIGISTDSRKGGSSGFDPSRMRGYLEIDEAELDKALEGDFEKVRAMFGFDSDGDLVVDSGVAFKLDQYLKAYVETGGILSLKTKTLDQQIADQKKLIEALDKQLAAKEEELKRKYGLMEGALSTMQQTSTSIGNLGSGSSGSK